MVLSVKAREIREIRISFFGVTINECYITKWSPEQSKLTT